MNVRELTIIRILTGLGILLTLVACGPAPTPAPTAFVPIEPGRLTSEKYP